MPTTFSSVKVTGKSRFGGNFSSGLVAAAVAGSILIGGNIFTDREQNATVNNYYGTGSYLSYDDAVCTNTGGLAKYSACSWQNPSSTLSGALMRVEVNSETAPLAAPITCMTSPNGTATGQVLFKYITTASGQTVGTSNMLLSGTGGRLMVVPPSWYVRCWHSRVGSVDLPGTALKEQLRVWYSGFYAP